MTTLLIGWCLIALGVSASAAWAHGSYRHGTATTKASCAGGCHAGSSSNGMCTTPGCHAGFLVAGARKWCWDCHTPGQSTAAWRSGACTSSSCHATTVHPGASGYGKTCTACHAVSVSASDPGASPHHDAVDSPAPACRDCHDGTTAVALAGHATVASCTACHGGMDRPASPAVCVTCHSSAAHPEAKQIAYTNDITCRDARCHGAGVTHAASPAVTRTCADCHTVHHAALGTCTTCHPDVSGYHHGTTQAVPIADCTRCHDGKIAVAMRGHAGLTCATCHAGMTRPEVPATCLRCHDQRRVGAAVCTSCHSVSGVFAREQVHSADPASAATCSTCHHSHYADAGACTTCHPAYLGTHHATVKLAVTKMKLAARPARVRAGRMLTLTGMLSGAGAMPSQTLLLQARRRARGAFRAVATATTGRDGRFIVRVRPAGMTEYRIVWRPAGAYTLTQQPALAVVRVRVR
ncbi:MAG: hypothetical protein WCN81_08500 [Actinomycetes bacterium]